MSALRQPLLTMPPRGEPYALRLRYQHGDMEEGLNPHVL